MPGVRLGNARTVLGRSCSVKRDSSIGYPTLQQMTNTRRPLCLVRMQSLPLMPDSSTLLSLAQMDGETRPHANGRLCGLVTAEILILRRCVSGSFPVPREQANGGMMKRVTTVAACAMILTLVVSAAHADTLHGYCVPP